jgi:hypothetical protein
MQILEYKWEKVSKVLSPHRSKHSSARPIIINVIYNINVFPFYKLSFKIYHLFFLQYFFFRLFPVSLKAKVPHSKEPIDCISAYLLVF